MERFKQQFASFAYFCRFWGCGAYLGSVTELETHEAMHSGGIKCAESMCPFRHIGLASAVALKRHMRKYHAQETNTVAATRTIRRKYVCSGVVDGVAWGCKQRFAVERELRRHIASRQGTSCDQSYISRQQTPTSDLLQVPKSLAFDSPFSQVAASMQQPNQPNHIQNQQISQQQSNQEFDQQSEAVQSQQQGSGVISQTQRLASAQSLLQQNPGIIKATDKRPFPPNIVNVQVKQSIPPDVKTWAQLKLWAAQNPGLLPNMDGHKLLLLQVLHFQDFMRQAQQQQQLQNAITNAQLPQQNNPGIMAQVPQMAPTQIQQQPNMAGIQVSPQEIALFRQRLPPSQAAATDQNLRDYLMQQKHVKQQQAMMNLQAQRNQPQAQPQPPRPGQAPMTLRPPPAQPLPAQ
jgi:hypothetical protein